MLTVRNKAGAADEVSDTLWLPYDLRQRGRLRTKTASGQSVGLFLERGALLRDGDLLSTDCGRVIVVRAASEDVITASTDDWQLFARACYHLGNRHVPLQIDRLSLRFQYDPVLAELTALLGLQLAREQAPFDPEPGAYAGLGHSHSHAH